ncbi:Gamma-glutamylputrescine oxidoreductase [Defluviimonas aquaemixtae]|uniref:Gamma-glutamylputrescine oxidoreductase n=1 Tax=Albidovulum aquaemixtae TaxID=1542388 RepID=A0A2R8B7N7_9RHOB|nr:FAD-binding oxidoreductase [Defluviimonas aquaemixtae]SPH18562.1 Gamma-glutamylputrescine oxidoreductase [Defluviimonas aquaemixtae]
MRRIYEDHGYGEGPVAGCYWDTTVARPARTPPISGEATAEVAVIGAGYTGLSAALHLARTGVDVAVMEAEGVGWGASGRNGGFVCLGGAKASDAALTRRFGTEAMAGWHAAQKASVALVADLLEQHGIAADIHSEQGETMVAHRPRDFAEFRDEAAALAHAYGVRVDVIGPSELSGEGLAGPGFHGALRLPIGFAFNPLKYVLGLAAAARDAGARIFESSSVTAIRREGARYVLEGAQGQLIAGKLILATNGYSSDDLPDWMAGRYLPAQSAVLVTRELSEGEIAAQGWTSDGMAYDTRNLLHYFRLMPNRCFLFGMRGGTRAGPSAQRDMQRRIRTDFEAMFPAWAEVETPHFWSGFVCLARGLRPYVGPLGDWPDAWAGFAWHGNGVALGTYAGRLLAGLATGQAGVPALMAAPPERFPFGRFRRLLLPAAYAWYGLSDRG